MPSVEPLSRQFVTVMRRPDAVKEWADTEDVLVEISAGLMERLGSGWEVEGPLYEGGYLSATLTRPVSKTVSQIVSVGLDCQPETPELETVPDELRFDWEVTEDERYTPELARSVNRRANLVISVAAIASAAAAYGVWRATRALFLVGLTFVAMFVGLLIADVVLSGIWRRRRMRLEPPREPSPEFTKVVQTVQDFVRSPASRFARVQEAAAV